ncbi:MAG: efflux RND transporter periplasmic adaptor subunit [Chloracidobacterium sp.]|nr:efflux RND transporter periplasmic adaptor subunit [Chloracidobacterium sp.]
MREEINEDIVDGVEPGKVAASTPNRKPLYVASGAVGIVLLGALGFWYLSTSEGGKAVPPPRSVSFGDNTSTEPSQTASEETITIPEDQLEKIGLKIETVGETLSGEAMSLSATGVVQPNAYKETPVISLLGGVVRKVSAELGSSVGRGQTVAVIFSNELAAAQSRYLALQTEAQTASQNYDRTAKLVRISPVSNTELDQALAALTTAEAELEEHHKHHVRTTKLLAIGAASREEFEMATTRLRTSEANVAAAKNRYARAIQVAEINPVSRSEFEQATVKRQTAESDLATARQRLQLFGLSSQKVNSLRAPRKSRLRSH